MTRFTDLVRFYALLDNLKGRVGGARLLGEVGKSRDWPARGVYFFYEPGEERRDSGRGQRVVRVGTHALTEASRSSLRQRLSQHRGLMSGGGNHRSSIFRLLIGQALVGRGAAPPCASWGMKAARAPRTALAQAEGAVEQAVTRYIGAMPFVWVRVDDEPGPSSVRRAIERNSIALLSNHDRLSLDPPSPEWLGHSSDRLLVRHSGLWNQRHVDEAHDPAFLEALERAIERPGETDGRIP